MHKPARYGWYSQAHSQGDSSAGSDGGCLRDTKDEGWNDGRRTIWFFSASRLLRRWAGGPAKVVSLILYHFTAACCSGVGFMSILHWRRWSLAVRAELLFFFFFWASVPLFTVEIKNGLRAFLHVNQMKLYVTRWFNDVSGRCDLVLLLPCQDHVDASIGQWHGRLGYPWSELGC